MKSKVTKLETGRYVIEYLNLDGWGHFEDQPTFATRKEAEEIRRLQDDEAAAIDYSSRVYQSQYAYACGYQD